MALTRNMFELNFQPWTSYLASSINQIVNHCCSCQFEPTHHKFIINNIPIPTFQNAILISSPWNQTPRRDQLLKGWLRKKPIEIVFEHESSSMYVQLATLITNLVQKLNIFLKLHNKLSWSFKCWKHNDMLVKIQTQMTYIIKTTNKLCSTMPSKM